MTPLRVSLALMLVMVAVLLAAGCAGQQDVRLNTATGQTTPVSVITALTTPQGPSLPYTTPVQNRPMAEGTYIFLKHSISTSGRTLAGDCSPALYFDGPTYSLDENNGELRLMMSSLYTINESLVLFYATIESESSSSRAGAVASAFPVYAIPSTLRWDNISLVSATPEGIVTLVYHNSTIVLKPKDRWSVNSTPVIRNISHGAPQVTCIEEIVVTDTMYNAGIFDKQKIRVRYT